MTPTQQKWHQQFGSSITAKFDFDLKPLTYMKIGGPAEIFAKIDKLNDVQAIFNFCQEHHIKITFLGGASNVIVPDEGITGVVVHLINSKTILTNSIFTVGAGAKTALVVKASVDAGLTGLEPFLGVPGSMGGAIYNNAHYQKELIGDFVESVTAINAAGNVTKYSQNECDFAYEQSRFQKSGELIWEVSFRLQQGDKDLSKQKLIETTQLRAKTQPLGTANSGCFFQNPANTLQLQKLFPQFADRDFIPAGFLIDQAGLKNYQVGDVQVSDKHAAFIINLGQGTAAQVKQVVEHIKQVILDKYQVTLKEEVFWL